MNLSDHYTYRWWHPWAIALFWILMMAFGCAPVSPSKPEPPPLATIVVDYMPGVGRIIIPGAYQGGINLCIQDPMAQGRFACARLKDLRRELPQMQYAEEATSGK